MCRKFVVVLFLLFSCSSLVVNAWRCFGTGFNDTCVLDVVFIQDTNFLNMRAYVNETLGITVRHLSDIFPGSRFGFATFANYPWSSIRSKPGPYYKLLSPLTSSPETFMDNIKNVDSCDSCSENGPQGAFLAINSSVTDPVMEWRKTGLDADKKQVVKFVVLMVNSGLDFEYNWSVQSYQGVVPPTTADIVKILRDNDVNIIGVFQNGIEVSIWLRTLVNFKAPGGYVSADFLNKANVAVSIEYTLKYTLCDYIRPIPGALGRRCKVTTTVEDARKELSTTEFIDSQIETFDDRMAKSYDLMWSVYGATYRHLNLTVADSRAGAGGIGNYASVSSGKGTVFELYFDKKTYFGLSIAAIPEDSVIEFYHRGQKLLTVEGKGMIDAIKNHMVYGYYMGNPNNRRQYSSKLYAFFNFYFEEDCPYSKVYIYSKGASSESFDTDNHTFGTAKERSGKTINVHKRIVPSNTVFNSPGHFNRYSPL